ncbi:methyltransferase domain-containing protein [Streptomyces aurantiacus]|uniref:Putative Demethylrebeccamycin-D-glucose O-methyltransferase n=1 Tax=Streptomyces aurantiacus JA 4570 TaxID=1286094 RepID=S3ZJ09_9ACTN|nr:methyltransferase domain-containing protein [Streptomyces aurantiacus]EPH43153.1 putative Demethylrebeccamycin-D-glucose O-methyltransferase [Streptomyces aurantiacus JA 4570]
MAANEHPGNGTSTPTPEEVGAMYDQFGDLLAMTLGSAAVHIGMLVPHDARTPVTSLVGLADLAQDRQTDFLVDTLRPEPGSHVLDIGCGTGGPALRLAERTGSRVTGITVSKTQLARCEERRDGHAAGERVDFAYGNAMELGHPDATFDAAWSIDCLPHLSDRPRALREALRVLKPGGHLLFTEFTLRGTPSEEESAAYTKLWTCPPLRPFSTLVAEVEEAGFRAVRTQDMSANAVLCSELMAVLYADRRTEMAERFGKEALAATDPLMAPYRTFCRDHLNYYLVLVRKPDAA